ncbi:MAG TPA: pyrimidine-nucleoside phosphorylase [bacterium]|nr:pyrimidine-nucleoside phosphorylase [bacterium]
MRVYDLIHRKRDGGEVSPEEIAWLVDRYARNEIPDAQMAAFLMAVWFRGMSTRETSALTMAMVRSGETLDLSMIPGRKVDKHSTGGVGDKTSIVLVPLAASAGIKVAKLSGRGLGHTGGTLDKLETIPGFRTELSPAALVEQVTRIGCAIAGQSARLVPADKRLYALRDRTATVDSVPLIASSVMSKKIAAGSDAIVLDVKTGSGAFMKTLPDARALAQAMVGIGREVGRRTAAVISMMDQPLGRAVGNALEVDEAIHTLRGDGPEDLRELCLVLGAQMVVLAGLAPDARSGRTILEERLAQGDGHRKLAEMVSAQGGDAGVVEHPERLPRSPIQHPVPAPQDGVVTAVDAEALGAAAMALGAGRTRADEPIDPGAGMVIRRKMGDRVRRGEPLAILHTGVAGRLDDAVPRVQAAYRIGQNGPEVRPLIVEVVE